MRCGRKVASRPFFVLLLMVKGRVAPGSAFGVAGDQLQIAA
jgi:hypothetical protein